MFVLFVCVLVNPFALGVGHSVCKRVGMYAHRVLVIVDSVQKTCTLIYIFFLFLKIFFFFLFLSHFFIFFFCSMFSALMSIQTATIISFSEGNYFIG